MFDYSKLGKDVIKNFIGDHSLTGSEKDITNIAIALSNQSAEIIALKKAIEEMEKVLKVNDKSSEIQAKRIREMKSEAGFSDRVSFDEIWSKLVRCYKGHQALDEQKKPFNK